MRSEFSPLPRVEQDSPKADRCDRLFIFDFLLMPSCSDLPFFLSCSFLHIYFLSFVLCPQKFCPYRVNTVSAPKIQSVQRRKIAPRSPTKSPPISNRVASYFEVAPRSAHLLTSHAPLLPPQLTPKQRCSIETRSKTMASLDKAVPVGRRKLPTASDDESNLTRRRSSASLIDETAPMPRRSALQRQSTPELEMLEKGRRNNMSIFDVVFPTSRSQVFLQSVEGEPPSEDATALLDTDVSEDEQSPTSGSQQHKRKSSPGIMEVDKYMARREMTPLQERMNAITVIPGAFYCFLFLLSGAWLNKSLIDEAVETNDLPLDDSQCLSNVWLPHLHAIPPLPVIAGAFGIICHAPFSFIYHWSYAHRLPAGFARTNHWSRRMDQAMIHFCSASMAYATSGRLDFFFANLLFNADCFYRQFQKQVHPRRNQIRIAISVVAYTIPIFRRGDFELFAQLWVILSISFILFGLYPIGGWSHSVFHLVASFLPPLLMDAALDLPASQEQLKFAAQCAALARQSFGGS